MSTENTLWMGDIEPWMTEQIIMEAFKSYEIKPLNIKFLTDKKTNIIRNYCFINFENILEANKALTKLNGKKFPNTETLFKLNWANYHSEFNKNVYVGNLSPDVDDIELYNFFKEKYPSVHHASVILENGISKLYGFVHFMNGEDYEKCLKEMDGKTFHGNIIRVRERNKKNFEKIEDNISDNFMGNSKFTINENKIFIKNNNNNINNNNINININNNNKFFTKKKFYKYNNYISNNNSSNSVNNSNCITANTSSNNDSNSYKNKNNFLQKSFDLNTLDISEINSFYPKNKNQIIDKSFSSLTEIEDSTFYSQEKELNSSSNTSLQTRRKFSYNFDLLKSNDESLLYKKIRESIQRTLDHFKYSCSHTRNNYQCKYIYIIKK